MRPLIHKNRIDITLSKFEKHIAAQIKKNRESETPSELINTLASYDQTSNHRYLLWILRQYLSGNIRAEDARVKDVLTEFHRIKPRLPVEARDIGKYDIYSLEQMIDSLSNKKLDLEMDTTGLEEGIDYDVIANNAHGLLVKVLSKKGACAFGKGTKWCTAASTNNRADYYLREGPLYIYRNPNDQSVGGKVQFHFETGEFRDIRDKCISTEELKKMRDSHPILSQAFKHYEAGLLAQLEAAFGK